MEKLRNLFSAVLAGFMVGVGATAYLACDQKYVGAFLFSVGLFTICVYGMNLFTGKIGYVMDHSSRYIFFLLLVWIGNFIGAYLVALFLRFYRVDLVEKAVAMCQCKMAQSPLQTIVLALFCGLLMYIAVDNCKMNQGISRYIGVFLCVPAFILCGFEHVVADMYYFFVASAGAVWNPRVWAFLALATIGNTLGSLLIPLLKKCQGKKVLAGIE